MLMMLVTLLLLLAILFTAERLGTHFNWHPELTRKLIHLSLGCYALTFPFIFHSATEVTLLCILATLILIAVRKSPACYALFGKSLFSVKRTSYGEIFFACSICLLFYLSKNQIVLYLLPLSLLTLCDASSALVGVLYAKTSFKIDTGHKSWEGTIIFFLTAWLIAMLILLLFSDQPRQAVPATALLMGIFGALIEAISWKGLDNLFIPIGIYLLLNQSLQMPLADLVTICSLFLASLAITASVARRFGKNIHAMNMGLTAIFFFWIVGSWTNLAAPVACFLTYLFLYTENHHHYFSTEKKAHYPSSSKNDPLPFILVMISTAMFWFIFSELFNINTYFAYNLSFSLHFAFLILLRFINLKPLMSAGVVMLAWLIINIRIILVGGTDFQHILLSCYALFILASSAYWLRHHLADFSELRWLKQTIAIMLIAGAGLPA